jgi:hypothetical protein
VSVRILDDPASVLRVIVEHDNAVVFRELLRHSIEVLVSDFEAEELYAHLPAGLDGSGSGRIRQRIEVKHDVAITDRDPLGIRGVIVELLESESIVQIG